MSDPKPPGEENIAYARLVFLLSRYQIILPRALTRWIPGGDWLKDLYKGALASHAYADQIQKLYSKGEEMGRGGPDEVVSLLGQLLDEFLDFDSLSWQEKMEIFSALGSIQGTHLLEYEEMSMNETGGIEEIPKFDTGLTPLDLVLGGFYQGIFLLMAQPGVGKTSLCLSLQSEIARTHAANSTLVVINELPMNVIWPRTKPLRDRIHYRETDKIICASWSSANILDYLEEHPDPDRVVFYDSPDVPASSSGEGMRFAIASEFLNLIRIKKKCKSVIATTWPRRRDRVLTISSPAEASAKAWYSDAIIGMEHVGKNRLVRVLKNRFGPVGGSAEFFYQMEDLFWEYDPHSKDEEW